VPGSAGGNGDGALYAGAQTVSQELAPRKGWRSEHTLMLLAAIALLVATLAPPLVTRRNGGAQ
jgi:hypothetical protein